MGNVHFLVLDVGDVLSGIEMSAVQRVKILSALDVQPILTTVFYNPNLHSNIQALQSNGRLVGGFSVLNLYNYFQDAMDPEPVEEPWQVAVIAENKTLRVENSFDLRVYNRAGDLIAYCKKSDDDKEFKFVNYLRGGRVFRRETFDSRGFLSRVETIEPQGEHEVCQETYLRPDGTVALTKVSQIINGIAHSSAIALHSESGRLLKDFPTEDTLIEYWLAEVIGKTPDETLIVDRVTEYLPKLIAIKTANRFEFKPKIVSVIHNVHTGGDVFMAGHNDFYTPLLSDPSQSDKILVLTEAQKNDISLRYTGADMVVVPHSYEPPFANNVPPQERPLDVVYLARYAPEKNQALAIEIFEKVLAAKPSARLTMFGFGPDLPTLQQIISDKKLGGSIELRPFVKDVASIYRAAKLSILTSSVEGFPLSLLDSLGNGCPVISFDVKYGPAAAIHDGVNGFLIEYGNKEDFAGKILRLLNDQDLQMQMSNSAHDLAKQFSQAALIPKWSELISHNS